MKSTHTKFLLIGAFLASIIFIGVGAAPAAKQSGSDRYIPTKREWLMLWAQAYERIEEFGSGDAGFAISFGRGKTPNSIKIFCSYRDTVDRRFMNSNIAGVRERLEQYAKIMGWDWLKIEEKLNLLKN